MSPYAIHVPSEPAPTNTTAQSKPLDKVLNRIARGAIYPVPTAADLPALLTALAAAGEAAPSTSAPVYADVLATKTIVRNDGSGWKTLASTNRVQSGSSVVTLDANGRAPITFPEAFSTSAPIVNPTIGDVNGTTVRSVTVYSWNASGFVVQGWLGSGAAAGTAPIRVNWIAQGAA